MNFYKCPMVKSRSSQIFVFLFVCLLLFAFRTFYGLNNRFWDEDEKHIYLLGLELFSFPRWPHFGPDIIHTATRIPGALQSFLVGAIFFFVKKPEAPFLIVNLLSLSALVIFALYLAKHFPKYRPLTLLLWLTSLPWSLEYTTHVYNPSYLLLPEVIFFIALFESIPGIKKKLFSIPTALFLMGLSIGTIVQLHLSWPILLPFVALSVWEIRKSVEDLYKGALLFTFGFVLPSLLLIPTIRAFGWETLIQMNAENSQFNIRNLLYFFNNLARLLSYGTYESFIFIGESMKERAEFLLQMMVLLPMFFLITLFAGWQILYFVYAYARMLYEKNKLASKSLMLFVFALMTSSFVFILSSRPPVSRNLYLLFPLSLWCMFLSIDFFVKHHKWGKKFFYGFIAVGLLYHSLVAVNRYLHFPKHSLYSNRELLVKSLQEKDPYVFETPRYAPKLNH